MTLLQVFTAIWFGFNIAIMLFSLGQRYPGYIFDLNSLTLGIMILTITWLLGFASR